MSASEPKLAHADGPPLDTAGLILPSEYPNHFAAKHPDKLALALGPHGWTYAELDRGCNAAVTVLHNAGVKAGDRVAYFGRNNDLFFIILIASIRAGIVMVPVNWRNTAAETAYVLDDCSAKLILVDADFTTLMDEADKVGRPRIMVDDDGPAGLRQQIHAAEPAPRAEIDPQKICLQLYTSGTTGRPKGVLTTQYAIGIQRLMEDRTPGFADWRDDEVLLSPLPSFHIGGLSWVLCGLVHGATVYLTADTTPSTLLDLSLAHGITRTFIVPTLVRALIEEMHKRDVRVPTLRGIQYGAASMDPQLLERSVDTIGCKFLQYYGMTEASGTITILPPEDHDTSRPQLLRSVGKVLPGFSIEIRGSDKQLLPCDTPGEIWAKGPSLFKEYWNRPEDTAAALIDGWYRSGDGGRLDENGYLYLTDRIKDMIVSGGENVYPAEVEAVLRDHPAVQDCAVFGLPHPKWGEGVTAAIELRPGHSAKPEEIIAFARAQLAAYKIPRRIEFGVTLPRTASGKVQRGAIRQTFLDLDKEKV